MSISVENRVIETKQLSQRIVLPEQTISILHDIDLAVESGEQIAITGRSGSGKSTLLGLLAALDQPSSGEVWLCGEPVYRMDEEARARVRLQKIGFIFQSFQLLPQLSALENVLLPMRLHPGFSYPQARKIAQEMLARVGLGAQMERIPKVLSGGEQQRVAIARALVNQPAVVFADEPTGNLDGQTAKEIEALLFAMNRELGTTLVLVTHDLTLAGQCSRQIRLENGTLVTTGAV